MAAVCTETGFWNFIWLKNSNKAYIWETLICLMYSSFDVFLDDNDTFLHRMHAEKLHKEGVTHSEEV